MARNTLANLAGIGAGVFLTAGGLFGAFNEIPRAEQAAGHSSGFDQAINFIGDQKQVYDTLKDAALAPENVVMDRQLGSLMLAELTLLELGIGAGLITAGIVGLRK